MKNVNDTFVPVPAAEAFKRLKAGNERFVNNVRSVTSLISQREREQLANTTQRPFAIVLCCSDSRAPAEQIFDQGLGDIFVVRVAGNIVAPSLVGSVEFAAATFGSQLVVVMGHSNCGAIKATLETAQQGKRAPSENIQDIIQRILPHVEGIVSKDAPMERMIPEATRANINASVSQLKHGSRILEDLVQKKQLTIIGAEYCLSTGKVEFFEEVK